MNGKASFKKIMYKDDIIIHTSKTTIISKILNDYFNNLIIKIMSNIGK